MQFPDEMLCDSVPIYLALNARLKEIGYNGCQLFVLADTSYGRWESYSTQLTLYFLVLQTISLT